MGLLAERAGNRMGMRQDFAPAGEEHYAEPDQGVISGEEFDANKKQLLGI